MALAQADLELLTGKIAKAEARMGELRNAVDELRGEEPPELRLTAMALLAAFETLLRSLKALETASVALHESEESDRTKASAAAALTTAAENDVQRARTAGDVPT